MEELEKVDLEDKDYRKTEKREKGYSNSNARTATKRAVKLIIKKPAAQTTNQPTTASTAQLLTYA